MQRQQKSTQTLKLSTFCLLIITAYTSNIEVEIHQDLQNILEKHKTLLDSSIGAEIIMFLGPTGSGKSTIINFLNNIPLKIDEYGQIDLKYPSDQRAMPIGHGFNSKTEYPKSIKSDEFIYYDMPGFSDTDGTIKNLANGIFYKNIAEKAHKVRLVFVVSQDDLTSNRGEVYKKLTQNSQKLFPGSRVIEQSSLLLVTKCLFDTTQELIEYINQKHQSDEQNGDTEIDESMKFWLDPKRIAVISKKLVSFHRDEILNKLRSLRALKVNTMNIQAIYDGNVKSELAKVFQSQMNLFLNQIDHNYELDESTFAGIIKAKTYFQGPFQQEVLSDLESSAAIKFLKPLLEETFEEKKKEFTTTTLQDLINNKIKYLNAREQILHQEEKTKIEEQQKIQFQQEAKANFDQMQDERRQKEYAQARGRNGGLLGVLFGAVLGFMVGGPAGAIAGGALAGGALGQL